MRALFPKWKMDVVCFDSYDQGQFQNVQHTRGKGGVATLWAEWMDPYARQLQEKGNERILVTLFDLPSRPLCVINCYLPSGTSTTAVNTFMEDMDTIHELICKHGHEREVIIAGDINADHHHRSNRKENRLRELIEDEMLEDIGSSATFPTYCNPYLDHYSRIDHILIRPRPDAHQDWSTPAIPKKDYHFNSSKHYPLQTSTTMDSFRPCNPAQRRKGSPKKKFDFGKADKSQFAERLTKELQRSPPSLLPLNDALEGLQKAITVATLEAVPFTIVREKSHKKPRKWSKDLAEAILESKRCHQVWKEEGSPRGNHSAWISKKRAKKKVRSIQRQQDANDRRQLLQSISQAHDSDQALFHRIIARQRKEGGSSQAMLVKGTITSDVDEIREEWAKYYQQLSTPNKELPELTSVLTHMREIARKVNDTINIKEETVSKAIHKLNTGKAPDKEGFKAEHLKLLLSSNTAVTELTRMVNLILEAGKIPEVARSAYKLPIPKKGKDARLMDNYRGITVTSIFGKLIEAICLEQCKEQLDIRQSGLQFGFTQGRSPSMASLMVTEAIAESKDCGQGLYICSVDARKAFDVVYHPKLKHKLFTSGINRSLWLLIDDMYSSGTEVIRWHGIDSSLYTIQQGVKQGAILSPTLYKVYANDLLKTLQHSGVGLHIGTTYVGAPGCADDILLLSSKPQELQAQMNVTYDYSDDHLYELHPVKSVVCPQKTSREDSTESMQWFLDSKPAPKVESFEHLGLVWRTGKSTPDISPRLSLARKTAYSLMGVGFHGNNGLDPSACQKLCETFVIPRMLYGLEATTISKSQLETLDKCHRVIIRRIQGLSESTAISAIYLLMGTFPVTATMHIRQLSLFGAITRLETENPLRQLAERQLAIKSDKSNSWFTQIAKLGHSYGINIHQAFQYPWTKLQWKKHTTLLIKDRWLTKLITEAENKKTLKWLIVHSSWVGNLHPLWSACRGKTFQVEAATTRVRILVGRYNLQSQRVKFLKQNVNPNCPLCNQEEEDTPHFLIRCPKLQRERDSRLEKVCQIYKEESLKPPATDVEKCSAVLNGWGYRSDLINTDLIILKHKHSIIKANQLSNLLCHKLHVLRDILINDTYLLAEESNPT